MKTTPVSLTLLALCGTVSADPSPEITYLAHEPASMLDVGLERLANAVEILLQYNLRGLGLKERPSVHASYDFERNQIEIIVAAAAPDYPAPKETCRQIVKGVQTWINSTSAWQDGFTHSGYTLNRQQDEAAKA